MHSRRWLTPIFLAVLSCGFLGHSPLAEQGTRRHISSCEDPSPKAQSVALPSSLFSFVQSDAAVQSAQAYQMFLMSMQINMALNPFARPSAMGWGVPSFPNFAVVDHYVAPAPVPHSGLAWHGLMQDPQLQYLVHPTQTASAAPGSLDALVGTAPLQTSGALSFTVGNSPLVAAPAGAGTITSSGMEISRL